MATEYMTLDHEMADAQMALNRVMGRLYDDDPDMVDLRAARDRIWEARKRRNPDLRD